MARPVDQTLRLRLIEAATDEFAARGYAAATMTHIGDAAGVTKGGVYFHFRNKESLFFAAVDHWRGRLRAALRATRVDPARSSAARLRAYLAAHLDFHFRHPQAGREATRIPGADIGSASDQKVYGACLAIQGCYNQGGFLVGSLRLDSGTAVQ